MKHIAIIPARSGSKGLKDKNIKLLQGKPLIAYTIEAALQSEVFDEVFVSTDSKEYAEIAKQFGAHVPFLREEYLATDGASTLDVIKDALEKYKDMGQSFDTVCILQPTSPLRRSSDIIAGYENLIEKEANAIIGVCEMDHSPIWCNTLPKDKSMDGFINKEWSGLGRQSLPTYYRINGALYISTVKYIMETDDLYKEKCYAFIMDKKNSVDIDDKIDFILAEEIMKNE